MNERYNPLFSLPENIYSDNSPVIISSGGLMMDNNTGTIFVYLNLKNIGKLPIARAKVEITCYDVARRTTAAPFVFEYFNVSAERGQVFGSQTAINILNPTVRSVYVKVIEVGFADNTLWKYDGAPWTMLPKQAPIEGLITEGDAQDGFKSLFGPEAKFQPCRYKELWLCTCGEVNRSDEARCVRCNYPIDALLSITPEQLRLEAKYANAVKLSMENTLPSAVRSQTNALPSLMSCTANS